MENRGGLCSKNTSGVRGVSWDKNAGRWRANVRHHGRTIYLGLFGTIEEAERVVVAKRNRLFTHNDADRLVGS